MTGKPTPGPWRYDENGCLRGSDGSFVGAFHEGRNDRRQRAVPKKVDRALIVAAPEMLELLHDAVETASECETEWNKQARALLDRLARKDAPDDAAE